MAWGCVGVEVLGVCDGFREEHRDVVVVQRVDDLTAASVAGDETELAQDTELLGDGRLFHLEVASEFGDRARGGSEPREDPNAAWCCERLHRVGDDLGGCVAELGEIDRVAAGHLRNTPKDSYAPPCMLCYCGG